MQFLPELKIVVIFLIFMLSAGSTLSGQDAILVRGEWPGRVAQRSFKVIEKSDCEVNGKGVAIKRPGRDIISYGWILNNDTRQVVWNSLQDEEDYYQDTDFRFDNDITLERGNYTLYFATVYNEEGVESEDFDLSKVFDEVIESIKHKGDIDYYKLYLEVRSEDANLESLESISDIRNNQYDIVKILEVNRNEYKKQKFNLKKDTEINIHYTGERKEGQDYDYARIYEMRTHKVVWPNQETLYQHAGGADKNVESFQKLALPAGDYVVSYVTDGSHAFDSWNGLPPKEPAKWGILVSCEKSDSDNVSEEVGEFKPLVDLRGAGNNDNMSQGFEISRDMDLRLICLGEYIDEAYDYGWIEKAGTHEKIWQLNDRNSESAGGHKKNIKYNDIVHLEKGQYILRYISDDSHSYLAWNEAPPYEQELWGISLWPVENSDEEYVKLFDAEKLESENIIVEISRVGDSREISRDFQIEKDGKVRVYAIGEGKAHRMYDTGWIENLDNGVIVWEMTYRKTGHAGGATKNRMYNGPVYLEKGNYRVHFKTDGSHSYNDWNEAPPRDQESYGIKILRE